MKKSGVFGVVTSSFLIASLSACSLDALIKDVDASALTASDAVHVELKTNQQIPMSHGTLTHGQGAMAGMGDVMHGMSGDTSGLGILLLPIFLPVGAIIGSEMASDRTIEEINSATKTLSLAMSQVEIKPRIEQELLKRIQARIPRGKPCVSIGSARTKCRQYEGMPELTINIAYGLGNSGKSAEPKLVLGAGVWVSAKPDATLFPKCIHWSYSHPLNGNLFELARNNGASLRMALENSTANIAAGIARDIFSPPNNATVARTFQSAPGSSWKRGLDGGPRCGSSYVR